MLLYRSLNIILAYLEGHVLIVMNNLFISGVESLLLFLVPHLNAPYKEKKVINSDSAEFFFFFFFKRKCMSLCVRACVY